jgi:hypothetical protein
MTLNKLRDEIQDQLVIRSNKGPQKSPKAFRAYISTLEILHEFTTVGDQVIIKITQSK